MNERDAVRADHLTKRCANGVKKPDSFSRSVHRARARIVVQFSDQMREHFRVGFRAKVGIAVADEFIFERLIIFDYPVVHERQFAAGIEVRVRIFVSDLTVCGPTRVANAQRTRYRLFLHSLCQRHDTPRTFARLEMSSLYDSEPG